MSKLNCAEWPCELLSDSPEWESIWILNLQWCRRWIKYTGYNGTNIRPKGIHSPLPSKLPISFQSHSSVFLSLGLPPSLPTFFCNSLTAFFISPVYVSDLVPNHNPSIVWVFFFFLHYLFLWLFHDLYFSLCAVYFCCSLLPLNIWQCTKKTITNLNKIPTFKYIYFANIFFPLNWLNIKYKVKCLEAGS